MKPSLYPAILKTDNTLSASGCQAFVSVLRHGYCSGWHVPNLINYGHYISYTDSVL